MFGRWVLFPRMIFVRTIITYPLRPSHLQEIEEEKALIEEKKKGLEAKVHPNHLCVVIKKKLVSLIRFHSALRSFLYSSVRSKRSKRPWKTSTTNRSRLQNPPRYTDLQLTQ
jgi:hypothetical protein